MERVSERSIDILPRVDYSLCGFSPVHGDKIAVFDVYLDESGTHNDRGLVVAGYVGDVNKWADFSVTWKAILDEYKISHFHMKTFRKGQAREFRHLSRRQKEELLRSLIRCIQDAATIGVSAMLRPYEYHRLTTPEFRSTYGSSYVMCVQMCVDQALRYLPKLEASSQRVGVFLEEGHKNAGQALEEIKDLKKRTDPIDISGVGTLVGNVVGALYPRQLTMAELARQFGYKIGAYGLGSKRDMLPLQAADILAYCFYSKCFVENEGFCTEVIDTINEQVPHYICPMKTDVIQRSVAATAEGEEVDRIFREDVHDLTRYLRNLGVDAKKIPDGIDIGRDFDEVQHLVLRWREEKDKKNVGVPRKILKEFHK